MSFHIEFSPPASQPARSISFRQRQFNRSFSQPVLGFLATVLFILAAGTSLRASGEPSPFEPRQNDRYQSSTLLPFDTKWRVLESTATPPTDWTQPKFNDESWLQGEAFVGNFENEAKLARLRLGDRRIGTNLGVDRRTRYLRYPFHLYAGEQG